MSIDNKDNLFTEKYEKGLFNNISHEVKTSLTIILWYAQLLKERELSTDELYINAVNNLENESKKLNSIVNEMIDKVKGM